MARLIATAAAWSSLGTAHAVHTLTVGSNGGNKATEAA
jgi:hypothetical protein